MYIDPAQMHLPRRTGPRPQPWAGLIDAVLALSHYRGELVSHAERNWASATFSGARHNLVLRFAGAEGMEAGEALISALPEHEFALPRWLVADATVIAAQHSALPTPQLIVEVELLVLEDG